MPVPSLGFHPAGFIPPAEPHVLSNAVTLLRLASLPVSASPPLPFQTTQVMVLIWHGDIFDAALEKKTPLQGLAPRERPFSGPVV
jgi:hypothetical protein